ncbi:MAG: hypothetical protein JXP34_08905 [Planctomycetes bacterium]|nr:hypothetical protein [Planctomycetota bacterium]
MPGPLEGMPVTSSFAIDGLSGLLQGESGFTYYPRDGLNVVVSGSAGSGKTLVVLQMAATAAIGNPPLRRTTALNPSDSIEERPARRMNVVYLTKDTPPETLLGHACNDFLFFDQLPSHGAPWQPPPRRKTWERDHPPPPGDGYAEWLIEDAHGPGRRVGPNIIHFTTAEAALCAQGRARSTLRFVFLDRLIEALDCAGVTREGEESHHFKNCMAACLGSSPFFALGSFHLVTNPASDFEEDLWKGPLIASLGRLCGGLRPFFEWLENGGRDLARDTLVVLDSLPPPTLEHCLMSQAERPETPEGDPGFSRPLALYVAESPDLPESLVASFPPDVQIKLGFREGRSASRIRTVQILKTRFQAARSEPFPFVIVDRNQVEVGCSHIVRFTAEEGRICADEDPEPSGFRIRRPGITILPSIVAITACRDGALVRKTPPVTFGNNELDSLTLSGSLAEGGCTLVATQNRCNSTALGLHFLLGAIARTAEASCPREREAAGEAGLLAPDLPRSVLYLAIDQDLPGVLHDIWRYPDLRPAIWEEGMLPREMEKAFRVRFSDATRRVREPSIWLHKIPLRHGTCRVAAGAGQGGRTTGPYLFVFTSDLMWCSQEELLERIGQILEYEGHGLDGECEHCLIVDRVLFNRVSRVHTRWPLIETPHVFVSSLAAMCRSRRIELMMIDDTAEQSETSGHISSHWTAISQTIIRLKRVPFHGTDAVALELVRSHNRSPRWNRPMQLRDDLITPSAFPDAQGQAWRLRLLDSFRGYTGLFSGKPERCGVKVDLPYDRKGTALYRDMLNTKANLESLIEGAKVRLSGPEERPGVNSALSTLAYVTQDRCHIAAIDEVWIHRMIGDKPKDDKTPAAEPGLVKLSLQEIERALRGQMDRASCSGGGATAVPGTPGGALSFQATKFYYVTEGMTIACKKAGREEGVYAMPFRHNWGLLAVARLRREALERLCDEFFRISLGSNGHEGMGAGEVTLQGLLREGTLPRVLGGDAFLGFAGVLLDREELFFRMSDQRRKDLSRAVHCLVWKDEAAQAQAPVSWSTLVHYKREIWDPVVRGIRERIVSLQSRLELPSGLTRWFRPDTVVNFFDFDRATSESVVSFLLELLLAHCDWDDIFIEPSSSEPTYGTASLIYLKTDPEASQLERMTNALHCMRQLLSPHQRREIAVGRTPRSLSDTQEADDDEGEAPRTYELLSRVWISTLPDLGAHRDLREGFRTKHLLPAEDDPGGDRLRRVISRGSLHSRPGEERLRKECRGKGPTISGTWYLGALSGGNVDVATDVIRELVSEYHERDRMIQGSAAPVTKYFYRPVETPSLRYDAPYATLVGLICCTPDGEAARRAAGTDSSADDRGIPTFPFCRVRIREYTSVSLDLAQLVRQVMELEEGPDGEAQLRTRISSLIRSALSKIRETYRRRGHKAALQ